MRHAILTTVASAALTFAASAQTTWYVDDDNCPGPGSGAVEDPFCSIQVGIDSAQDGDEIVVAPGWYDENLIIPATPMTLRSAEGPTVTTISGETFPPASTVVVIGGSDTLIEGFTIRDGGTLDIDCGSTLEGGGMHIAGSPMVRDCIVTSNHLSDCGVYGGGLWISGPATIVDCTISGNTSCSYKDCAVGLGGGAYVSGGATFIGCTISDNRACNGNMCFGGSGGGVYGNNGTFIDCTISSNEAGQIGGGLSGGPFTLIGCTVTGNRVRTYVASGKCGGADISGGLILACVFERNSTEAVYDNRGGAVCGSSMLIVSSLFTGNSAGDGDGGAIFDDGNVFVSNCTFINNSGDIGAIYGEANVANSIIWDNSRIQIAGGTTVTYSNVQGGWPGEGNIDLDPLFVDAITGNYRLLPGSPCIDAGHNWGVPQDTLDVDGDGNTSELVPLDLDGNPRFNADELDFNPGCGLPVVVDMGAYEYQFDPVEQIIFADLDGDGSVNASDLIEVINDWGICDGCCLTDLNLDGFVDVTDLVTLIVNWG